MDSSQINLSMQNILLPKFKKRYEGHTKESIDKFTLRFQLLGNGNLVNSENVEFKKIDWGLALFKDLKDDYEF
jgi:hypothetical protein